jgi:hypothetical protein
MHHASEHRFEIATALQQAVQPMLGHIALNPHRGRHDFHHCAGHRLPRRPHTLPVENDEHSVRSFLAHDDLHGENGIGRQGGLDLHRDRPDRGARSGQG